MAPLRAPSVRRVPYPRAALTALTAAAALLAAGCADGDGPSAASAPPSPPASPASSPSSSASSSPPPASSAAAGGTGQAAGPSPSSGSARASGSAPAPPGDRDREAAAGSAPRAADRAPWCGTGQLRMTLRTLGSGAGQRYAALVLINSADSPCRTRGWPGLQLTSAGGAEIQTRTDRDRAAPAQQFTMRPGDRAWSRLHWTVVPGAGDPPDGSCPRPAGLRVIPPDERRALSADWKPGPVCGGKLSATALRLGSGPGR
ncbi:DUF4232 domain-containing protein [Streptomyces boncukensis]|uniref:DUF4232 domain-containing protein n=1 Tax=Streptomyces boncukensis TaxID=2711219 RepID=A0A6G4X6V3_9ACTN|nr:DUF4232 domain-containing protein [Streptomyces boncukensis]NGO73266.1 DUF4232 domain-containing protein [Streptomyces boncukensis]